MSNIFSVESLNVLSRDRLDIAGQRVYFGSSESMTEVLPDSVPFFVTSPPYWNLKDYGGVRGQIGQEPYPAYIERLNTVWEECYRIAAHEAILVINVKSRRAAKRFYPIAFDIAGRMKTWELWDVLIWYIPNALPQPNHYMNRLFDDKFEYLLVFKKGNPDKHTFHKPRVPQKYATADPRAHKKNADGRCIGNIIRIPAYRPPNVKALGYHVAAFPEELVAILLETYTNEDDRVLDPFLGSGTTLKVARHMNRQGIGYELNESYRPLIEARIKEDWAVPDWRDLDIIHSTRFETGMEKPRKIHFHKNNGSLFEE